MVTADVMLSSLGHSFCGSEMPSHSSVYRSVHHTKWDTHPSITSSNTKGFPSIRLYQTFSRTVKTLSLVLITKHTTLLMTLLS